jgi:hypothetical protein
MPYYHLHIAWKLPEQAYATTEYELDLSEEEARQVGEQYEKGKVFFKGKWIDSQNIIEVHVRQTARKSTQYFPTPVSGSDIFMAQK